MANKMKTWFLIGLAGALTVASPAFGATAIESFSGGSVSTPSEADRTIGFSFTADTNLLVTALGIYDYQSDGLAQAHQIGIWNNSGTLLTSATVSAGTSAALADGFRYVSIAGLNLVSGMTYTIGAERGFGDDYVFSPASVTTNSSISILNGLRSTAGTGFVDPTNDPNTGRFGPNFQFTDVMSAVPEPATWAMMILGMGAIGFSLRSAKRRSDEKFDAKIKRITDGALA